VGIVDDVDVVDGFVVVEVLVEEFFCFSYGEVI